MTYASFLRSKMIMQPSRGIEVAMDAISSVLFPFQRQLVQWGLRKGRCALFADTGLGKTLMQLEWARLTGERTLIIAPLAVTQQTVSEAGKLGISIHYVRNQSEVTKPISIANYEMLKHFDANQFGAIVLDESSILKSEDGKTRTALIEKFRQVPYRLACTATPAPNDIAEFANHAEFLGICTRQEMLSTFFVHDDVGWRLKGHAKEAFYQWLASWAMMLKRPSDIGFDDNGFVLPPLTIIPVYVEGNATALAQAQGQLFPVGLGGITGRSRARRLTIGEKVATVAEMVNSSDEQWLVWCGLNDEGREAVKAIRGAVLVEGSDSLEAKVAAICRFVTGEVRVLVSKPTICGFGLNLQHCHNMAFIGLSDSYEEWYQAIRRVWRFGQRQPVRVSVVISNLETAILENIQRKERQAEDVSRHMVEEVSQYQQVNLGILTAKQNGYHEGMRVGEGYTMLLGDCVERLREVTDHSVDLSVFSPPFLSLYTYSDSERDMGNSRTEEEFFLHFGFLIRELLRVMRPGRNVCCHVAQVPAKFVHDGFIGLKDFRGGVIRAFVDRGFVYHGEVVIDKDPQAQAIRTHAKGLLFAQLRKDSSWLRPGLADYLLVFRAPGENDRPILPELTNDEWIEYARPIWYGIRETDTLHVAEARTERDERHIAPLQLGTIDRCIRLWSNPTELVLSPFAGIGSEGYVSLKLKRRFVGIELKEAYFNVACNNLERIIAKLKQEKLL